MSTHELSAYDGQECIGKIHVAKDGKVTAFDPSGKGLGRFLSVKAASVTFETKRAGVRRE
jgi:hypothetical protein